MFRIDDATAATSLPTPEAAGTEGFFTEGNPATGTPATNVRGSWLNMIQEELRAIVVAGGITPSKTTYNQVLAAIKRIGQNTVVLNDTGAANAYTAANATPLVTGTWVDGVVQAVKIAHTNTGASTYAPDGLSPIPIYGLGLQPLQQGELFAGGTAILMRSTIASVNSGNPICVLMECAGGAQQIPPAVSSQHAAQLQQIGHGQCRLSVTNTTTLTLKPYNGNNVIVNGVPLQLPSAGITVSNSGLSASTLYYVYLGGTTASPTLSLSTTGHSTAPNGVETQTGNTALTLVGMIYTNASSQFVDAATTRNCLNWFNRRSLNATVNAWSVYSFTSTGAAEVTTSMRCSFLNWADEAVIGGIDGEMSNNTAGASIMLYSSIDGSQFGAACGVYEASANLGLAYSSHSTGLLSEGYHTASVYGQVTSGTGSIQSGSNAYIIRG